MEADREPEIRHGSTAGGRARSARLALVAGSICVALGVAADAAFLPHQSLWNDEATQMCGLSLDPIEATKWLAGRVDHDFGVPNDRMPPLSYYGGWAWSRIFGLAEAPMRWFGVACVSLATAVVFAAAWRSWGLVSGAAAALLLALSPNVVVQAVEIRAYPLLILASAGVFACLMQFAREPVDSRTGRRWLFGIVACAVAAMYAHFFGLVIAGGALTAALIVTKARSGRIGPVLAAGAFAAVAALGLAPFVMASVGMTTGGTAKPEKAIGLVRLAYRLFSHPATSVSGAAVALAALGFAISLVCALIPGRRSASRAIAASLALALAAGLTAVACVSLAQSSIDAANPSYNAWLLPGLALLMASGLASERPAVRRSAWAGVALLTAANLYADSELALRGDSFAHTPHRPIRALIREFGPTRIALIHDAESPARWHIYSPIRHEFGGMVRQFQFDEKADNGPVHVVDYPERAASSDPVSLPCDTIIVVRSSACGAKELADQVRRGVRPLGDGPVAKSLLASRKWRRTREAAYLAFVRADADIFERVPAVSHAGR